MALPGNISYGTVVGRFMRAVIDGPDSDRDPDGIPMRDVVIRFTPSNTVFKNVTAAEGPVTIVADPIAVTTDETGRLVGPDGVEGIRLIATDDPDLQPENWTWQAQIQAPGLSRTFSFLLPADTTLDLTTIVPVPSNPGSALSDWEQAVQRAESISQDMIVDAKVLPTGDLEFTRESGQKLSAGNVRGPEGPQGLPGVNAVPATEAVATYISTPSVVQDALDARYVTAVVTEHGTTFFQDGVEL